MPRFDIDVNRNVSSISNIRARNMGRVNGYARSTELTYKTNDIKFCTLPLHRFKESGCTVFQGKDFMVRNYDYHPATYDGRYLLFNLMTVG